MADITQINGTGIELVENGLDKPVFADQTIIKGFGLEFVQSSTDLVVRDVTQINGFGLEFLDYPAYVVPVILRRF